ncbi:MAG: WXG100 family type VII secretion target [Actinomycetota bacterium]|nr:WXG100 family type VII secretion target [Actinomycetota bacterium]
MTKFQIDTDELDRTAVALAAMAALSERLLTEVDSLAASVSTEWSGEANEQFLALKAEWAQGAKLMSDGIHTIHRAATTSHTNYQAVADAARRVW